MALFVCKNAYAGDETKPGIRDKFSEKAIQEIDSSVSVAASHDLAIAYLFGYIVQMGEKDRKSSITFELSVFWKFNFVFQKAFGKFLISECNKLTISGTCLRCLI